MVVFGCIMVTSSNVYIVFLAMHEIGFPPQRPDEIV